METVDPCSFSKSIDGFDLTFTLCDGEVSIKAESQVDSALYSCKLSDDTLPESARVLFEDVNDFYEGYLAILNDSSQTNSITFDERGVLSFTHQTMISLGRTKVLKVNIQLEREVFELETEVRRNLAKANKRICELERQVNEQETQLRTLERQAIEQETETGKRLAENNKRICQLETYIKKLIKNSIHDETYEEIHPEFNPTCKNNEDFTFSNANRTITSKQEGSCYYTVYAKEALPIQGKFRFSVRIDSILSKDILIGIMHESQKYEEDCSSAQGSYSLCLCTNKIYKDASSFEGNMVLMANENDTVSILVDMDAESVAFYIENELINRIKCNFNAFQKKGFYPCVTFYENGHSASFI